MITNYIPDTCKYSVNNLKKVVHIFSSSSNVIHIDNGEAYVTSGITDLQTISATSVSFEEAVSYDDRFKFQKTVTATVNGFAKLSALGGKYYIVLEDVNSIMWLVNADFPSLVTYTYTLQDGTDETVFTFSALSNFPTLKLNSSINNAYACQNYSLVRVDEIKMLEKRYANINAQSGLIYGYSSQVYKTVRPYRNSIKVEETFDGTDANTTIQFNIGLDDYQSSWHYNMLEYPYNKYVAVIDHLACGFEMGLVPSYNVQGSHQIGGGDTVTVTLVGGSQRGSEWAENWTEVTVAPVYEWRLSDEWMCQPVEYRWTESGTTCVGVDKYQNNILEASTNGENWFVVIPEQYSASTLIEAESYDCGYIPPGEKYRFVLSDSTVATGECSTTGSNVITSSEVPESVVSGSIGDCVTSIGDSAFRYCTRLSSITLSNSIITIDEWAFHSCTGLTSVNIPTGVTSIGGGAFQSCYSLTNLIIPDSVTDIGAFVFTGCQSLTSVTIGSGVTSIGLGSFNDCGNLTSMVVDNNNSVFDSRNNCNAIIETSTNTLAHGCNSSVIPNTVTSIGRRAFYGCEFTNIGLPNGLNNIGNAAFQGCSSLSSITIPSGVTVIDQYAFESCSSLSSITIPSGVTVMNYRTFRNCTRLRRVTCLATTPPQMYSPEDTFDNTPIRNGTGGRIYVPSASVNAYKSNWYWSIFSSEIYPIPDN